MKERPILFNGDMVRAILDGRKTQTRRLVGYSTADILRLKEEYSHKNYSIGCPFGQLRDRIWVRETWQAIHDSVDEFGTVDETTYMPSILKEPDSYWHPVYAADNWTTDREERGFPWRPAIHMPRWASRITLEITAVRVEHLQDISEEDAKAEGAAPSTHTITPPEAIYRVGFLNLWCSLYGEESWQANPWCWVIEFKRVEADNGIHSEKN